MKKYFSGITAVLAAVFVFLTATPAFAAVTFNNDPNDKPTIQVVNVTRYGGSAVNNWSRNETASAGDDIAVQIYYHNTGTEAAQNTRVYLSQQTLGPATTMTISGGVSASNGGSASDSASLTLNSSQTLTFVPGSVRWYINNAQTQASLPNGQTGSEMFSGGMNLGSIGPDSYPRSFSSQGVVTMHFAVSNTQTVQNPIVSTLSASNITTSGATLTGNLNRNGNQTVSSWFEYSLGNTSNPTIVACQTNTSTDGAISCPISGLQPNQIYSYRYAAQGSNGVAVKGQVSTFTTQNQLPNVTIPTVHMVSASAAGSTSGIAFGSLDSLGNAQNASVYFEYNPGTSISGSPTATGANTVSTLGATSLTLNGLTPNTTYAVRFVAINSAGRADSSVMTFTTNSGGVVGDVVPATGGYSNLSTSGAVVSGYLSIPTGASSQYRFEYATAGGSFVSAGSQTAVASSNVSATLSGLNSNTTYQYRLVATGVSGALVLGETRFFTTLTSGNGGGGNGGGTSAQIDNIMTNAATSIYSGSASLNGFVSVGAGTGAQAWFEYGTSMALGSSAYTTNRQAVAGQINLSHSVTNLQPNTTYYFRAMAQSGTGTIVNGSTLSFSTNQSGTGNYNTYTGNLSAFTNAPSGISDNSAILNGYISSDSSYSTRYWFDWGSDPSQLNNHTSEKIIAGASSVSEVVSGLQAGTKYYFQVAARNYDGTVARGSIFAFNSTGYSAGGSGSYTSAPLVQTNVASRQGNTNNVTLNGYVGATGAVNTNNVSVQGWFEWGLGPNALTNRTTIQNIGSGNFNTDINNLELGRTYYFRAVAQNSAGTSYGNTLPFVVGATLGSYSSMSVTTLSATPLAASMRLNGSVNSDLNSYMTTWFEYGPTSSLGLKTAPQAQGFVNAASFSTYATGLSSDTTYFYQAVADNGSGNVIRGAILTTRTTGAAVITSGATSGVARATLSKEVTNLTFPNGTKTSVAGTAGNTLEYTINLANTGTRTLTGVRLIDPISPFVKFETASDGGSWNSGAGSIEWNLGSLSAGESRKVTYRVTAKQLADNVVASGEAKLDANELDKMSNSVLAILNVQPLSIYISTDKPVVGKGESVTMTLNYKNEGANDIDSLVVKAFLPAGTEVVSSGTGSFSGTDRAVVFNIGRVAGKASGTIGYTIKVSDSLNGGELLSTSVNARYMDTFSKEQITFDTFSTLAIAGGSNAALAPSTAAGIGLFASTSSFLPTTLIGWLGLILLIIVIVLVVRKSI